MTASRRYGDILIELTDKAVEQIKEAMTKGDVPELIKRRWSPRAFTEKAISRADLRTVLEGAQWAASGLNEQPWRFILGLRGDETYNKIFATLAPFNQSWAVRVPVLIVVVAKKTWSHSGAENRFGMHDVGAATASLSLTAGALGMHTHLMAGYDVAMSREAFSIPDDFESATTIALGYFGEHGMLGDSFRERETTARTRKPMSDFVFSGSFGEPASI